MDLQAHLTQLSENFNHYRHSARIILLHPKSRYRSVLVAKLVNHPEHHSLYYALSPDDISVQAFITGLTHDLANQYPMFGRHIHTLQDSQLDHFADNEDLILEKFILDLEEVSKTPFLFILDEYDRSDIADDVQRFIERLVKEMPERCTLVINSRTLPRLPWVAFIARNEGVILLDDQVVEAEFHDQPNPLDSQMDVYALGPGFVLKDNQFIDAWEGHLPRLLLFFALDRPIVTRSDICRAFWPELSDEQAVNVFHVTKRRLHKALNDDVLLHDEGYYYLNPDIRVFFDVLEFARLIVAVRNGDNPNRLEDCRQALALYRGPFLQGHNEAWVQERRADFAKGFVEALSFAAYVWEADRHNPQYALALYREGLPQAPDEPWLHCEIMRLYQSLGRASEGVLHYQAYEAALKAQGRTPAETIIRGYEALRQEFM